MGTVLILPLLLVALTVHEISHGLTAYKLGDETAKRDGRFSLNPIKHLDPVGFLFILFVGVGWAKPVMVNPYNLKNPKIDMALISAAGPISNFIMAFAGMLISVPLFMVMNAELYHAFQSGAADQFVQAIGYSDTVGSLLQGGITMAGVETRGVMVSTVLFNFCFINVMLGVFNLIPFPPLDGSKIAAGLLPDSVYEKLPPVGRYSMIILFILVMSGALRFIIFPITDGILGMIYNIGFSLYGMMNF
jgi:Zn-dependent protease